LSKNKYVINEKFQMKRAVICVPNPWDYIPLYEKDYSIMVLNPGAPADRNQYLLNNADWSLLVTPDNEQIRAGSNYPNEKVYWYTSGTTGDSKFYGFTHEQVDYVCQQIIQSYQLTANDRYASVMSLWHAHGQMFYWVSKMVGMETTFLPINRLQEIAVYSPTFITGIPDILKALMKQRFDHLRFVRSASAALPPQLHQTMKERFGVPIVESFGMTESCSHCLTNPLEGEQRIGTVGLPVGVEARLENNRLYIKGPAIAKPGWFDTGDLAEQDEKGYYRILGRSVDRINVRGYKLDPLSLENKLYVALPDLKELAVFGTDSVKCIYNGPYDKKQIKEVLVSMGRSCYPSVLEAVDVIPKNAAGKVSRTLLDSIY
jgi:acyl-coenzyme A synthetase/AMP-(fatty) acid ligase